jgi:hypothetical protein
MAGVGAVADGQHVKVEVRARSGAVACSSL